MNIFLWLLEWKWLLILSFVFLITTWFNRRQSKLPPGPTPWPIVGNLLQFDVQNPLVTFHQWAKQYGPVYRLYMGSRLNVIINDHEILKNVFSGHVGERTSGRPYNYMIESLMDGKGFHGIVAVDGDKWKEQRRFSLSTLRDFGFGKTLMEDKISQETNLMLRELREKSEFADDCDVILPLKYCVGNIIASMAFGKTFPRGNNEFEAYQKHLDEVLRLLPKSQLLTFFPFLKYTCPNFFNYGKLMSLTKEIQGFLMAQISSHLTDEPTNTEISDIASAFAQEMRKQSSDANSFYTKTQLRFLILDLFAAGQETTVTTLSWAILYFLYHPEVQTKIQAEILEKVGGMPNWGDRLQLPYTCAVIAETQRISNIVPLGVQHETIEEVEIGGYKIPPKTMITSNLYSIHNDPKYFPNPEQFIPERFLDESGCLDKKKFDSLMPFSVGKRVCLGESLARMELFLILSALLINFSFEPVDKKNMPSLKPRFGVTVSPVPFKVKLIVRS